MKRKVKYAALAFLFCFVLLFAYVVWGSLFIAPFFARREARRLLSTASSPQQLQEAIGSLGAYYPFPDGSWLAIRYRDSHAGGIWSLAVARDSGGNWYESREHFCGAFRIVPRLQQVAAEAGEPFHPTDERSRWLFELSSSPDLQTARQRLTSRYFVQLQ